MTVNQLIEQLNKIVTHDPDFANTPVQAWDKVSDEMRQVENITFQGDYVFLTVGEWVGNI